MRETGERLEDAVHDGERCWQGWFSTDRHLASGHHHEDKLATDKIALPGPCGAWQ